MSDWDGKNLVLWLYPVMRYCDASLLANASTFCRYDLSDSKGANALEINRKLCKALAIRDANFAVGA